MKTPLDAQEVPFQIAWYVPQDIGWTEEESASRVMFLVMEEAVLEVRAQTV